LQERGQIRLCVAIPIANEAGTIEPFLRDVLAQLGSDDRVLLVIDNVSTDGTRTIVQSFIAAGDDPRVSLIEAPENRCVSDAYVRGYRESMKLNPRWVLEMDAGYSHDPNDIPRFIQAMEQGFDYVGGSRFAPGGRFDCSLYRRLFSQGGTWVAGWLLNSPLTDLTSGFQCYNQKAMALVLEKGVFSKGGFFQTEIRYYMSRLNWTEIPIAYGHTERTVPAGYVFDGIRGLLKLSRIARQERN
jgi:dolichol-phosphate mannosyltransferase